MVRICSLHAGLSLGIVILIYPYYLHPVLGLFWASSRMSFIDENFQHLSALVLVLLGSSALDAATLKKYAEELLKK